MRRNRFLGASAASASLALVVGALLMPSASADTVSDARSSAYGLQLGGPVPISATPTVENNLGDEAAEDALLEVPADPVATSFTALVQAETAIESTIEPKLQATITGEAADAPETWNARGFAITEDLEALADNLTADVIESESTAACVGKSTVFGSATRILNLSVGGTDIPVINPSPNQVIFDQGGIRIVFWETNWDGASLGTTDDADTVFTNALHVTAPLGVDLVVSHSEATSTCAAQRRPPRPNPPRPNPPKPAPPAQPVPGQPVFAG